MKYILFFLLLLNLGWATEKKVENKPLRALTGLQKFEVITLFSSYEKMNSDVIFNSVTESLKKFGQTAISENESMIKSLVQFGAVYPICFFSIDKDQGQVEVSLDILAEVEVLANQYKTTCPVWKKTLYSPLPQNSNQADVVIAGLMQEMIKDFTEDWVKANNLDSSQLSFHVRKFKNL